MSALTDWQQAIDRELRMTPGCDFCRFGGRACPQCLGEDDESTHPTEPEDPKEEPMSTILVFAVKFRGKETLRAAITLAKCVEPENNPTLRELAEKQIVEMPVEPQSETEAA